MQKSYAASNTIRYAGYRYDVETGLYYLNARMYNPHTGRFLQADTYAGRLSDPLSLNLYTYCLNNPTRYVDPSGHFAISATLVAIFAMAALNAGFEMFNQKVVQKREKMNWWLVGFEAAIGGIMGYGGAAMAGMMATGAGTMLGTQSAKQVTAGVLKNALFAGSYAAIDNMAHQTLDGRKLREVDYGSVITSAEIAACFSLAVSVVAGGVQNMRLRRAQKAQKAQAGKITEYAHWENPYRVDENELIAGGSNNSTSRLHSKINKIVVKFNCNSKYDTEEFARQLANQEKGMNELTVSEYLENRERFIAEGRTIEGNVMQQAARAEARTQKIAELRKKGFSYTDAMKQADEWLNTQAALHNPDQIAGGNPQIIGGIGDKKINSSIGAQWRYRIDAVDKQIQSLAETMTKEEMESTYLNIKLVYEILGE